MNNLSIAHSKERHRVIQMGYHQNKKKKKNVEFIPQLALEHIQKRMVFKTRNK